MRYSQTQLKEIILLILESIEKEWNPAYQGEKSIVLFEIIRLVKITKLKELKDILTKIDNKNDCTIRLKEEISYSRKDLLNNIKNIDELDNKEFKICKKGEIDIMNDLLYEIEKMD